jgi:hypothetical protein
MRHQKIGLRAARALGTSVRLAAGVACALACGNDAGDQTQLAGMSSSVPGQANESGRTDSGGRPSAGPGSAGAGSTALAPSGGSPFKSLDAAANAPETFTAPRAGVPLANEAVAFIATQLAPGSEEEEGAARPAVFLQVPGAAPRVLYAGELLVSPLDIETSADGETLFVADYAGGSDGSGAILSLPAAGGEASALAQGYSPRSVTLGPNDLLYFSGVDPESGEPGVFQLGAGAVTPVFRGAPLVDPSGIAPLADGSLLVADTRLLDGDVDPSARAGEAGIVRIAAGQASVFSTGFATGFPAGIALTVDERTLIISGQGPDRSDTVYLVDVSQPELAPTPITAAFSIHQDSSAGLKRAHRENTFIWASLSAGGGTVFKIRS